MKLAYLTNLYPAPSHSFIRREIQAHERAGHEVMRYSIRRFAGTLADPQDRAEAQRTRVLLDAAYNLPLALFAVALAHPLKFIRAARQAVSLARASGTSGGGVMKHFAYLAEACLLLRFLRASDAGHLHVHFGTNPAAVALLCRILGGPSYSFTAHGPDEFDAAESLALADKIEHAAFAIAISQFGRSQLCRWVAPRDYGKFHMVRCGLDDAFLRTAPTPIADAPRFVFVGRLTATKGIFVLIEAITLLKRRKLTCRVALIGDGPEREVVEQLIAMNDLSQHVQLLGWQSQDAVRREIEASRALVLPSFAEGLPIVLMESLALGRPVITAWVAGIPELVEHNADGWLVPPGDVEALADALQQALLAPPAQLEAMGHHGRAKVLRNHNADAEAAKLAELFLAASLEQTDDLPLESQSHVTLEFAEPAALSLAAG